MDSYLLHQGTNCLASAVGGNSCQPRFIDLGRQTEMFERNVFYQGKERSMDRRSSVNQREQSFYEPVGQGFSSRRGMNLGEIPVVENTFSLPRNVFERVWSSQQRISTASTSEVGTRTAHSANTAGHRRHSGDYVTESTESEAKRPRLSPSEQAFAQKKQQQKQLKLQHIMQRLNNTREKVKRLLELQKSRESLRRHENPSDKSTDYETVQRRYVLIKRKAQALNSFHGNTRDKNNAKHSHSQFQGARRVREINVRGINVPGVSVPGVTLPRVNVPGFNVPGINVSGVGIFLNGVGSAEQTDQRSNYSCNSFDSAGLALDHQTYPKIVAVHSVIENPTLNAESCGTNESRPYHGASTTHEQNNIISGRTSEFCGGPPSDHMYEERQVRQKAVCLPLTNNTTSLMSNSRNYEDDEVVLTKVIPGKVRRSTSTLFSGERKHDEADLVNCNQHRRNNSEQSMEHVDQLEQADRRGHKDNQKNAEDPGYVSHPEMVDHSEHNDHAGAVNHTGHTDHPGAVNHTGHTDHPGAVNHTGHTDHQKNAYHSRIVDCLDSEEHIRHVKRPENVHHPQLSNSSATKQFEGQNEKQKDSFEHPKCSGSDLDLGGPPSYLPVLDNSEMIEQEKEMSQQRPVSNPTSPRLTKTLPEISAKIIETRKRIKNETIDWKKCVLYRLEKRLIQKLRRVERLTGQKTEIEDLRQEVPETVTKGKKSRGQGQQKRTSRQDSVTESGMDDDVIERRGQERKRSRQDSVTDSVTDEDSNESHEQERISSRQSSAMDDYAVELQGEENGSSCRGSVTDNVTADNIKCPGRPQQEEKVVKSDNKQIDSSIVGDDNQLLIDEKIDICEDLSEKCEESKNAEISFVQKGNMGNIITENKEDKFTVRLNKFERSKFSSDKKQGQGKLAVTNTNDNCMMEHSEEATALQTKRKSDTIDTESAQKQTTELPKVSQEKPRQQLQCDNDKNECVALRSNASGKHRAVERGNLFETLGSRSQASDSPKKDTLRFQLTNKEASINTIRDTSVILAEREKTSEKGAGVFMKTLESCDKEALDNKLKTVDCGRNIWSTLRKGGIL